MREEGRERGREGEREGEREGGKEGGGGKEREREHGRETERDRVRDTHTHKKQPLRFFSGRREPPLLVFSVADMQLSNWCQSVSQTV